MPERDSYRDVMLRSIELTKSGHHREALSLADEWIANTESKNGTTSSVQFMRLHAGVIARAINDLPLVRRYCEHILSQEPENVLALYTLADVLFLQGENDLGRCQAARAYALVRDSSGRVDRDILELLIERWPEIDSWKR
jgi:hypothetical protein